MLDTPIRQKLEKLGVIKHFREGDVILAESSFIRSIPIVLKGTLRVMRPDEAGREMLLYYIKPGESCVMSFLGGLNHDTSKVKAVVEDDAEILLVPVEKANELSRTDPRWNEYIFKLYQKRFEELLSMVNSIAFHKLDQRILDSLKKKAALTQSKEISITHQQLADELGTSREVVSRLLKQMENEKLVTLSRNKISLM
ncbi:MAG TPA: Crp/Fnr family transcriptional regulator [Chitinophagales bacterium]|nr:Crp/Fnr family transcriptional regulator [Chitinophagales bacterium]